MYKQFWNYFQDENKLRATADNLIRNILFRPPLKEKTFWYLFSRGDFKEGRG